MKRKEERERGRERKREREVSKISYNTQCTYINNNYFSKPLHYFDTTGYKW